MHFPWFYPQCFCFFNNVESYSVLMKSPLLHNHKLSFSSLFSRSSSLCLSCSLSLCACGWISSHTSRQKTTWWWVSFCLLVHSGKKVIWGCHATVAWLFWFWHMVHQALNHPEATGILSVRLHISQLPLSTDRALGCAALRSVMFSCAVCNTHWSKHFFLRWQLTIVFIINLSVIFLMNRLVFSSTECQMVKE